MTKTYVELLLELRAKIVNPEVIEQLQTVKSFEEITKILKQAL